MNTKINSLTCAGIFLLATTESGFAQGLDYEIRVGATHTDNVARQDSSEISDTLILAGLGLSWGHETRTIDFGLELDATFNHFLDDTFDEEVIGESQASLLWSLAPDRLLWNTTNQFGTIQTDVLGADTPDNRGTANHFSTGPELILPIGSRTSFEAESALSINSFEERTTDNEELSGSLTLRRDLNPVRSLFLTASYSDVDFDDNDLSQGDYERGAVFLGVQSEISSGSLSASVGFNEIDVLGQTLDGTTYSLSMSRDLSLKTRFTIDLDQRISGSGDIFRQFNDSARDFGETVLASDSGDPFESRRATVSVSYEGDRTTLAVSGSIDDQNYEATNAQERQDVSARLSWTRRLPSDWQLEAKAYFRQGEFTTVERKDDDISARLTIRKQLSRLLSVDLAYQFTNRSSSDAGSDFEENAVTLLFAFSPD